MSLEPPAIRLVREALEERLPPRDAATALFAALTEWGPRVPTAHDEILELIRGPLERALSNRMGAREARIVLDSISEIVVNSEEPTGSYGSVSTTQTDSVATRRVSRDELTASLDPDDRITEVVSTVKTGRVRLVVASASDGFARHLQLTIGADLLDATTTAQVSDLRTWLERAAIDFLVVDGGLPPTNVPVGLMAKTLRRIPSDVWCAIWGADLDYGRILTRTLFDDEIRCIPLTVDDGIAPLVDLIRSRNRPLATR